MYSENKKSLAKKVLNLKIHIENFWLDLDFFKQYDIKNLWNNYFRVKFIPYRLIIFIWENNIIEFVDFFKRKWKSDYKHYN
jgi:mRNA-degrading endonuclease RelE of RelBE toxin-antitoxin system